MNRRDFNKLMLMAGIVGSTGIPLGIRRAAGQSRGGTLDVIIQPEPPVLVAAINQQAPTLTVAGKIYQSLLKFDFDQSPRPGLAKSWEMSDDGLTYTFHLEETVKWHDGTPFTAEDVVFSTTKILPETHARARGNFARCESITATDAHTVVFKLKEPFGPFLQCFEMSSCPIMPKHLYEGTDYRNNPHNAKPIGTGPWKFAEWERGSHIRLVRNDEYYKPGQPYLDEIIYRIVPDAASRALALENGTVDLTQWGDVEMFDVPRLKQLPHVEFTTKGYEFYAPLLWLEFNNRIKPMDDKRFRQAVMHAIDKDFLVRKVLFGLARPATGPMSKATKFYDPKVKIYDFNPAKAIALLDEMGLKPGADGKRAKITYLVPPYGEVWMRFAEYIRQALSKVGIEVVLEAIDVAGWATRVGNWDFEVTAPWLYQFGDPALGVSRTYVSSNIRKGVLFSNTSGYSNPKVDALFAEAAIAVDPAKRQALYSEVQRLLVEEVPVGWLVELDFPTMYDKRFHDLVVSAIGVNDDFDQAWFEG